MVYLIFTKVTEKALDVEVVDDCIAGHEIVIWDEVAVSLRIPNPPIRALGAVDELLNVDTKLSVKAAFIIKRNDVEVLADKSPISVTSDVEN